MTSSSVQKVSAARRSTAASSKTSTRIVVKRGSVGDFRKATTDLSESSARKPSAAQPYSKSVDIAATQPIETESRSSMATAPTSSSRTYISDVEERLQSKLQDLYVVHREKVDASVTDYFKMTPRSPLMQIISITQKIPAERSFRMLLSVTLLGTIWEVRVIVDAKETVKDVIKAALAAYSREGRKLSGESSDHAPEAYELYLSPYSLHYLEMDAKIMDVGARNFVLRRKREVPAVVVRDGSSEAKHWWALLLDFWK